MEVELVLMYLDICKLGYIRNRNARLPSILEVNCGNKQNINKVFQIYVGKQHNPFSPEITCRYVGTLTIKTFSSPKPIKIAGKALSCH